MALKQDDSLNRSFADPLNPTFVGGSFKTANARRGAAQARNPDIPVYQQDNGTYWLLKPLNQCFLADGVTPATNRGSWGTLNKHWRNLDDVATAAFFKRAGGKTYYSLSPEAIAKHVAGFLRRCPITERVNIIGDAVAPLPALPLAATLPGGVAAPGSEFTLTAAGVAAAGSPQVANHIRGGSAGSVIVLSGENMLGVTDAAVYTNGKLYPARVRKTGQHHALVQLPANIGGFDLGVLWLKNSQGYGVPVVLNSAEAWWAQEKIVAGELATVYGRSLAHGNVIGLNNSFVYVESLVNSQVYPAVVEEVHLGQLTYRVPAEVPQGAVHVHVHNGHGKQWGTPEPVAALVVDRQEHIEFKDFPVKIDLPLSMAADNTNGEIVQHAFQASQAAGGTHSMRAGAGRWPARDCMDLSAGGGELVGAPLDENGYPTTIFVMQPDYVPNIAFIGTAAFASNLRIKRIAFENPDGTPFYGPLENQIAFNFHKLLDVAILDCAIIQPRGVPIFWQGGVEHVYARRNQLVGHGSNVGEGRQIFLTGNKYGGSDTADSLFNVSGSVELDVSKNVVGDYVPGSTELANTCTGRFDKAGMNYGSAYNHYNGFNVAEDFGPLPDQADQNAGEWWLREGVWQNYGGYATAFTANSFTVAETLTNNYAGFDDYPRLKDDLNVVPGKHLVSIIRGPGMGQTFQIVSHDGHTVVLDRNFTVQPTAESLISIGLFTYHCTVEGNLLTGRDGVASRALYNVNCGEDLYGGGRECDFLNNTHRKLRAGTRIDGTYEVTSYHGNREILTSMFINVEGNSYEGCRKSVMLVGAPDDHTDPAYSFPAAAVFGARFSRNTFGPALVTDFAIEVARTEANAELNDEANLVAVSFDGGAGCVPDDTLMNYWRDDEGGIDPVVPPTGTLDSLLLAPPAEDEVGVATLSETVIELGDPEPLPVGTELNGNIIAIPETGDSQFGYDDTQGQWVPMDRTPVVSASGAPAPSVDAFTKAESLALLAEKANLDDLADLADVVNEQGVTIAEHTQQIADLEARKANVATLVSGSTVTSYATSQEAANAAQSGDYLLLRGYQKDVYSTKSITIDAHGAFFSQQVDSVVLGAYPPAATPTNIKLVGGYSTNRMAVVRQNAASSFVIEDHAFDEGAWFELFALAGSSAEVTTVTLRRCRGLRTSLLVANGGNAGYDQQGCIAFQSRSDSGQRVNLILEDCAFKSTVGPVFSGLLHPDCRIYLRGTTELTPADGFPLAVLRDSTGPPAALDVIIVDERPAATKLDIRIATGPAQQDTLTQNSSNVVPFSVALRSNAPAGIVDLAAHTLNISRTCRATITLAIILSGTQVAGFYQAGMVVYNGGQQRIILLDLMASADPGGGGLAMYTSSIKETFTAGDVLSATVYPAGPGQYRGGSQVSTLTFIED